MKGATPLKVNKTRNWLPYIKPVSIGITLFSLLLTVVLLLLQLVNKEVKNLEVVANFKHVSQTQIEQQLEGVFPAGFVSLDVTEVQTRLEDLIMVSSARVEKIWPDTLKVEIQEEAPVAIWNHKNMLNEQGVVLPIAFEDLNLPRLTGTDSGLVMQHFLLFKRFAKLHQLNLTGLMHSASGWFLSHGNGLQIRLDGSTAMQGLKSLEAVIDQFQLDRISSIDMRYEQGFAVAWKEPLNEPQ